VHDYRRRRGVVHAQVILPRGATCDRQALWSSAELAERRKDARVAREWEVALPCELSTAARRELARQLARWLADRYGVAVDLAIHAPPHRASDRRNHHAHLLLTTRVVDVVHGRPVLGGKAQSEWDDRQRRQAGLSPGADEVRAVRAAWAQLCNAALSAAGLAARVDHRSLRDQGVARAPTVHVGRAGTAMKRRGEPADRVAMAEEVVALEQAVQAAERALAAQAAQAAPAPRPARAAARREREAELDAPRRRDEPRPARPADDWAWWTRRASATRRRARAAPGSPSPLWERLVADAERRRAEAERRRDQTPDDDPASQLPPDSPPDESPDSPPGEPAPGM
jgi:hypothetical protein